MRDFRVPPRTPPLRRPHHHATAAVSLRLHLRLPPHERRRRQSLAAAGTVNLGTVLLPGLMAVAIMFTGIAAVALPLSQEFGITREIDDRVMCPLPVAAVAFEKVCFSALQSILAAVLVFPLAYYIPAIPVQAHIASWPLLIAVSSSPAWSPEHSDSPSAPTSSPNRSASSSPSSSSRLRFSAASTIPGPI